MQDQLEKLAEEIRRLRLFVKSSRTDCARCPAYDYCNTVDYDRGCREVKLEWTKLE